MSNYYYVKHPPCCLMHNSCLIMIWVEVKSSLNRYSENANLLSYIAAKSCCHVHPERVLGKSNQSSPSLSLSGILSVFFCYFLVFLSISVSAFLFPSCFFLSLSKTASLHLFSIIVSSCLSLHLSFSLLFSSLHSFLCHSFHSRSPILPLAPCLFYFPSLFLWVSLFGFVSSPVLSPSLLLSFPAFL